MTFNDLNNIEGIQFMPIALDKRPIYQNWQSLKTKYDFTNAVACGLVCGSLSRNVEAIDFDLKYDLSGTLMNEYIKSVNEISPGLIEKLVVQRTKSGGYHLVYRCSEIEGNQKLANRPATIEEKEYTYNSVLQAKNIELFNYIPDEQARFEQASIEAKKSMDRDKVRVLIETRGEKGQIACYPTPGYEMVQGSWLHIPEITPQERSILFEVAYSFNTYFSKKEDRPSQVIGPKNIKGKTPSEDFNERGDVVALLQSHGWTVTGRRGGKVLLKRPGQTSAKSSGNYDEDLKWFSVFSTSTEFESQKPYKPYAVFAMLECNGDYSQVTKKLADLGYGDPLEKQKENSASIPSIINMVDDEDYSFIAGPEDYDDYINKWRTGTFVMGLNTGIPELDKYFRFKEGNLVMVNGIDNVGKSIVMWYMQFLAALLHGWKCIIFSSENRVGAVKKKIIEFYWCKQIDKLTEQEYLEAESFFNNHFKLIKNDKTLYNYQDLMNITIKTLKIFKANTLLLDPYNSLKVESSNHYGYHYEAASLLKLFGEEHNLSIYLNTHAGTQAAKRKDKDGHTLPPEKEDTEMGVMFPNKADDFLTIHRLTQHDTEFMYTELHVRKIKETETGGRPTPKNKPIYLRSIPGLVGFEYVHEKSSGAVGFNPVKMHRDLKNGINVFSSQPNPEILFSYSDEEEDSPF